MPSKSPFHSSDMLLAFFVIAIAAMLLLPLPTRLLDFLLVINISISLLVLLAGLYMPNSLALLSFPTLLLLTTLFRLGLNVASTRLILSQGEAGEVIRSFGEVLIGNEVAVGLVIFIIITIVNFIVIARGASRVSEVAARFALDALPGKQLAIDSDLRSSLISPSQAQAKREDLRKESQLYGAMDGAMRFVQGDAVAGFFIIFTNIIGGLYLGLSRGDSFSDAVRHYTILTVGDGLVSQIPALLMSICAGLVVTRVSSGENTTLSIDVGRQVFASPMTLLFVASMLLLLGSFQGLPDIPFYGVGLLLALAGGVMWRSQKNKPEVGILAGPQSTTAMLGHQPSQLGAELAGDDEEAVQLEIVLDAAILYRLYRLNSGRYTDWWQDLRTDFFEETGCVLPKVRVLSDEDAAPAFYVIRLCGTEVASGSLLLDHVLVEVNSGQAEALGLTVASEAEHPLNGSRVFWAQQSPTLRKIVEAANIRVFDFFEYIALNAAILFHRSPEEAVPLTFVHRSLSALDKRSPGLLADMFGQQPLNVARLAELLQELVRQGLSIKDFRQVVECLALYCSTHSVSLANAEDVNWDDIVSFVRRSRRRQIVSQLQCPRRTLKVFALSASVEGIFEELELSNQGLPPAMEPGLFEDLKSSLLSLTTPVKLRGILPVAILCRAGLRNKVAEFLKFALGRPIDLLVYEELDPQIEVEILGQWAPSVMSHN